MYNPIVKVALFKIAFFFLLFGNIGYKNNEKDYNIIIQLKTYHTQLSCTKNISGRVNIVTDSEQITTSY